MNSSHNNPPSFWRKVFGLVWFLLSLIGVLIWILFILMAAYQAYTTGKVF